MKDIMIGTNTHPSKLINYFGGEYDFLCNFYEDAPVRYDGIDYLNSEAAFAAHKTTLKNVRKQFSKLSPGEAKALGRTVNLRKDWEDIKFRVMSEVVHAKFTQNSELVGKLLATGVAYLEEGNIWEDRIWGTVDGEGDNWLGIILMAERAYWKEVTHHVALPL